MRFTSFAKTLTLAATMVASGCTMYFQEVDRNTRLSDSFYLNHSLTYRYLVEMNKEDGIRELVQLAREAKNEEAWVYIPEFETWIEAGRNEGSNSAYLDLKFIKALTEKYDDVEVYHIHPNRAMQTTKCRTEVFEHTETVELYVSHLPSKIDFENISDVSKTQESADHNSIPKHMHRRRTRVEALEGIKTSAVISTLGYVSWQTNIDDPKYKYDIGLYNHEPPPRTNEQEFSEVLNKALKSISTKIGLHYEPVLTKKDTSKECSIKTASENLSNAE